MKILLVSEQHEFQDWDGVRHNDGMRGIHVGVTGKSVFDILKSYTQSVEGIYLVKLVSG